jgi:shikimate kinase
MGSGKTTLGHELARRVRCRFIDMDHELEKEHQLSIPEIFNQFGEEQFRAWETELLQSFSIKSNLVVATGGGLPCFHNNMKLLNASGITIYLKLSTEVLFERLSKRRGSRPLIMNYSDSELKEYILSALIKREPYYMEARHIVDAELISVQDLIQYTSSF